MKVAVGIARDAAGQLGRCPDEKIDATVAGTMKMAPFVINAPASVTPGS